MIFVMLYLAVAGRLAYVQVFENEQYQKWADKIRSRDIAIPAERGTIYDRSGAVLAVNIETASIYADLREVREPEITACRVASIMGCDTDPIQTKLTGDKKFVWLGRQVDARIADRIRDERAKFKGIGYQRDTRRVYPAGALAAQILGFTNIDNKGVEGIECVVDDELGGQPGLTRAELDGSRRVIPETRHVVREPRAGHNVYLTIDLTIQHIAEQALARMGKKFKPYHACAIVIKPDTGEVLALANYPTYDPNKARSVKPALWRNRAVADLYEPGSTLKVVTVAAGLNEGYSARQVFASCSGKEQIGGGRIRCSLHHPYEAGHGTVDMYQIIRHSCNIGAAHLAFRLGAKRLYDYEKSFGLLNKPKSGFGCEAVGWVEPPDQWRAMRLANVGFGQGLAVTPLQMAGVYSTIANNGKYVKPHVIKEIRSAEGEIVKSYTGQPGHRVISEEAANELKRMLAACAEEGTGKTAQILGRTVAGKTGSAQVARSDGKGYEASAFVASFMGFVPAYQPRLVIAVVVNRPQGSHFGATVAAPVFREIGEKSLWYMKVPSDAPIKAKPDKPNSVRKPLA